MFVQLCLQKISLYRASVVNHSGILHLLMGFICCSSWRLGGTPPWTQVDIYYMNCALKVGLKQNTFFPIRINAKFCLFMPSFAKPHPSIPIFSKSLSVFEKEL